MTKDLMNARLEDLEEYKEAPEGNYKGIITGKYVNEREVDGEMIKIIDFKVRPVEPVGDLDLDNVDLRSVSATFALWLDDGKAVKKFFKEMGSSSGSIIENADNLKNKEVTFKLVWRDTTNGKRVPNAKYLKAA